MQTKHYQNLTKLYCYYYYCTSNFTTILLKYAKNIFYLKQSLSSLFRKDVSEEGQHVLTNMGQSNMLFYSTDKMSIKKVKRHTCIFVKYLSLYCRNIVCFKIQIHNWETGGQWVSGAWWVHGMQQGILIFVMKCFYQHNLLSTSCI